MNATQIENRTVYFSGVSRRLYPFTLYPLSVDLPNTGAVYIYARIVCGDYEPLYIGETDNLKTHIEDYEKWVCVNRYFVNTVCVHFEDDTATRQQIVYDLISEQQPTCNQEEQ